MKLFESALLIAFLLPVFIGIGCSDNGSNSTDEIPANLVDIWWYDYATMNGDPIDGMHMIGHEDETLEYLSLIFSANGTWEAIGYTDAMVLISTVSGTFTVSGDNLNMRMTARDGAPIDPPDEQTWQFVINGDILTFTVTESDPYIGEIIMVMVYNRD